MGAEKPNAFTHGVNNNAIFGGLISIVGIVQLICCDYISNVNTDNLVFTAVTIVNLLV